MDSNKQGTTPEPEPDCSRRNFLKLAGGGALLLLVGKEALSVEARPIDPNTYDWAKHAWLILVDTRKCIGCGSCVRACKRENNVPDHHFRTWVERYQVSATGEATIDSPDGARQGFEPMSELKHDVAKGFFVPKLCNHCTNTPCRQVCPVGASYRTMDGVILVDEKRCMGCGYCVQACPYGSRFLHPETHIATKCTLCYHRITKGLLTACTQNCPVAARQLGDSKAIADKVARIVATERVAVLKPELLTEPNCYYLGLDKAVR